MKISYQRAEPAPVTGVHVEFTPREWHDLQTIASIPYVGIMNALKLSTKGWAVEGTQTYGVYQLLDKIAGAGK